MVNSLHKRFPLFAVIAVATPFATLAIANDKKTERQGVDPKHEIEVLSQVPVTNGAVTGFWVTQHSGNSYLYAQHEGGKLTLIDVTNASAPVVLGVFTSTAGASAKTPTTVTGTATRLSYDVPNEATQNPQTVRIMDFSDPRNPKVAREFTNVTAMNKDVGRGLVFLADHQNIWILSERFSQDPQEQTAYHEYVLYGSK